eukprot:scaffold2818_cov17-Tisochrysis_lutea.AAC.1
MATLPLTVRAMVSALRIAPSYSSHLCSPKAHLYCMRDTSYACIFAHAIGATVISRLSAVCAYDCDQHVFGQGHGFGLGCDEHLWMLHLHASKVSQLSAPRGSIAFMVRMSHPTANIDESPCTFMIDNIPGILGEQAVPVRRHQRFWRSPQRRVVVRRAAEELGVCVLWPQQPRAAHRQRGRPDAGSMWLCVFPGAVHGQRGRPGGGGCSHPRNRQKLSVSVKGPCGWVFLLVLPTGSVGSMRRAGEYTLLSAENFCKWVCFDHGFPVFLRAAWGCNALNEVSPLFQDNGQGPVHPRLLCCVQGRLVVLDIAKTCCLRVFP